MLGRPKPKGRPFSVVTKSILDSELRDFHLQIASQFAMIAPLRSHRTVGCWQRSRLRGVLRIALSNPKCGKRNSFPHFGRRWPGLSTLSGNAGISLRFAQKALLERAGKLELFLQPAEGNRDHALLDALHHTCAGINVGFDMAFLPCYRSN